MPKPEERTVMQVKVEEIYPYVMPHFKHNGRKYFIEWDIGFHEELKEGSLVHVVIIQKPAGNKFGRVQVVDKENIENAKKEQVHISDDTLEDELEDF